MNNIFKDFLIQCGNQYMVDNVLDEEQIITLDNFLDYVFEKLQDIELLRGKLR